MAGTRGSTNGSGAGTRTARGAAEGRAGAGGRDRHTAASSHGRITRRTLTIGEAAAALSVEFPGVTAAALRRIEAAGQFIPARSSSGYRRYSEADLDLIRIVLSNQSAAQGPDPVDGDHPAPGAERATWPGSPDPADLSGAEHPLTHPGAGQSAAEDALATAALRDRASGARYASHSGTQGASAAAGRATTRTGRAATSRVPAARSAVVDDMQSPANGHRAGRLPATDALFDVPAASSPRSAVATPQQQGVAGLDSQQSQCPDANGVAAGSAAPLNAAIESGANARSLTGLITNGSAANGSPSNGAAASTTASRRADRRWPDAEFFAPDLGEVALDRDQLAAAARTDRAWVDGLVEYGLLSGNRSAGGADLLVARAAAELAQFGMEPRHLRAVAASAARVAELITSATSAGAGTSRDAARRERTLLAAPGRGAEAAAAAVRLHAALVRAALLRG
jgi:hypothetical protein